MDHERERDWHDRDIYHDGREKKRVYDQYVPPHDRAKGKEYISIYHNKFKIEDVLVRN